MVAMTATETKIDIDRTFSTDDLRWQAVVERDVNADGAFYYSVSTTGVYCRPCCAARLARRENVAFHNTSAEAEQAGFRSCKRCRPSKVTQFAIGDCSFGAILVAATDKGVCAILLDDDLDALVRDLHDRFPKAQLIDGDEDFEKTVANVVGFVEAPALSLDLPLDVRGTTFQQKVWAALREIPAGETASYGAVAKRIGSPKAVRAVAGACAANSIAVAIPCHRVVRNDGEISGYRWGVERKQALLEREATS